MPCTHTHTHIYLHNFSEKITEITKMDQGDWIKDSINQKSVVNKRMEQPKNIIPSSCRHVCACVICKICAGEWKITMKGISDYD